MNIRHAYTATGTNNSSKQVSVDRWNEGHVFTGTPNMLLGFNSEGVATEQSVAGATSRVVGSRAAMSALTDTVTPVYLTESGREGVFVFSGANLSTNVVADTAQGIYVAPDSDTDGSSGAWVRKFSGALNVKWFGATGDGVTDDSAEILAAIAYARTAGFGYATYGVGGPSAPKLFFPAGAYIMGSTTIDLTGTMCLEGEGTGYSGTGSATNLIWTDAVTGIRIQTQTTSGASTSGLSNSYTGKGSTIRNMLLRGAYSGVESEAHGIHMRGSGIVENVAVELFPGDGFHISADAGTNNGNANLWSITGCRATANRNGLYASGGDSNAGYALGLNVEANRDWGVYDNSFLGNTYIACHSADNGSGGYTSVQFTAKSLFLNCYSESGEPASAMSPPALVLSGQIAPGVGDYPGYMFVDTDGLWANDDFNVSGDFFVTAQTELSSLRVIGDRLGGSGLAAELYAQGGKGHVLAIDGAAFMPLKLKGSSIEVAPSDTTVATFNSGGLDLAAGKTLEVNGTQVVGTQGAAVADATDAASAITQLNALLARCRAHGLIAT